MNSVPLNFIMMVSVVALPLVGANAQCPDPMPTDPEKLPASQLLQCISDIKKELTTIQQQMRTQATDVRPPGATLQRGMVVALDDSGACPSLGEGWADAGFGGKFLMAADTKAGSKWDYRTAGGQPEITISPGNIPPLYIGFHTRLSGSDVSVSALDSFSFIKPPPAQTVLATSNNPATPIPTLPPYVSLYFCKRTK